MTIAWSTSLDDVNWQELEALYRVAPLGNKPAALLQSTTAADRGYIDPA